MDKDRGRDRPLETEAAALPTRTPSIAHRGHGALLRRLIQPERDGDTPAPPRRPYSYHYRERHTQRQKESTHRERAAAPGTEGTARKRARPLALVCPQRDSHSHRGHRERRHTEAAATASTEAAAGAPGRPQRGQNRGQKAPENRGEENPKVPSRYCQRGPL